MELTPSIFALVKELSDFSYELSFLDPVWNILFPDKGEKWHHLHVNKYKHTFYVTHVDGGGGSLEVKFIRFQDWVSMHLRFVFYYDVRIRFFLQPGGDY